MIAQSPKGESLTSLLLRVQQVGKRLKERFLDKEETVRLLLLSALASEHMLLIGPPGTAKSALLRLFSNLIDANYFEYLLTRFTEPNEIFGPVDISAFRQGSYKRRTEGMLPEAEIVFLDEIFKANSAILNSLLTLLNERRYQAGAQRIAVPLISLFGASNEVPTDESLAAVFDRFLLRTVSHNLDSYHFYSLAEVGLRAEGERLITSATAAVPAEEPLLSGGHLQQLRSILASRLTLSEDFLTRYKSLVFQIRTEGIALSDRRVVKLLKLFCASALLSGREHPDESDFFILKHVWNSLDQIEILEEIVNPVLERYQRENPQTAEKEPANLSALLFELKLVRDVLSKGDDLSDIQLFSQLKHLGEIRVALSTLESDAARVALRELDELLATVFQTTKFS